MLYSTISNNNSPGTIIKSEFCRLNNKFCNIIIDCGKRFQTEKHLLSAIAVSGMALMTAYVNIYKDGHVASYNKKLTYIAIACFWICQKFLDDKDIYGKDLQKVSGISYQYIKIEERKILAALDFKICAYMQGERPCFINHKLDIKNISILIAACMAEMGYSSDSDSEVEMEDIRVEV